MSCEKRVLFGPPPSRPVAEESTGLLIYNQLRKNSDYKEALIDSKSNENETYEGILEKTCRLANGLSNCGIGSNHIIAICSENNVHFAVPLIAALYIGAPIVPISFNYNEYEVKYALELVKPDIIFCSNATVDIFLKLKPKFLSLKRIVVIDQIVSKNGAETLKEFMEKTSESNFNVPLFRPTTIKTNHTAFILFSAGTTGSPKGVVITHANFNTMLMLHLESSLIGDFPTPAILGILPFYLAYGLSLLLGSLINGRKLIVFKEFDPVLCLENIEKYKVSVLFATPSLMQFIAKSPLVDKYNLSSLKKIICGGGVLNEALESAVANRLKLETIRQGYGLTETTLYVTITPTGYNRPGSCGKLVSCVSGIVRNPKTGAKLAPFQSGELCFKGGVIMQGYYKNDAANEEAFTADGWFRTGDLGYYDNDGYFYVLGRLKDIIKYKKFQILPSELEGVLLTHPKIKDGAVVGLPDESDGELALAFVVKQPDAVLMENEVTFYLSNFLLRRKHLHGGVKFVEKIPRNENGQILRRELREMLKGAKSKL